eukprot:10520317-Prorocentrum_lima.AAC.1
MTSSLVGSEMCIRDSPYSILLLAVDRSDRVLSDTRNIDAASFQRDISTVSYTHLTLPTICSV